VVEAVGVGNRVVPPADFAVLLERPVQVTDLDVGLANHLAVELGDDTDDPVHGRMLRPHAELHGLGATAGAGAFAEHELARGRGAGRCDVHYPLPSRFALRRCAPIVRSWVRSAAGGGWSDSASGA